MSSIFAPQVCVKCDIKFDSVEQIDVHMKFVHHEYELQRIERRFDMATFAVNSHTTAKEHSVTESKKRRAEPHSKQKLPDGDENEHHEKAENSVEIMLKTQVITSHQVKRKKPIFQCDKCEIKCISIHLLKYHKESVHIPTKVKVKYEVKPKLKRVCGNCGSYFSDNKKLTAHLKKMHEPKFVQTKPKPKEIVAVNESDEVGGQLEVPRFKCELCEHSFLIVNTLQAHMKIYHSESLSSNKKGLLKHKSKSKECYETRCHLCGKKFDDNQETNNHIEESHGMNGGGENESDNQSDDESDDEEAKTSKVIYSEKEWGHDDTSSEPSGKNLKSKQETFAEATNRLKKIYRKNSVKSLGNKTIHVVNVQRKGTGTETEIDIEDSDGKGKIALKFWGPNKKTNETTIQITTTKGSNKKFVNIFMEEFVKPIIERTVNGIGVGNFFKKEENLKRKCEICQTKFIFKTDLDNHNLKRHSDIAIQVVKHALQENVTESCDECNFKTEDEKAMMAHMENVHSDVFWLVGAKRRKRDNLKDENDAINSKRKEEVILKTKYQEEVIAKKIEQEDKDEESRKRKAETKRLQKNVINIKTKKDNTKMNVVDQFDDEEEDMDVNTETKDIMSSENKEDTDERPPNVSELPESVKCIHPESWEFSVPGDGACCLNCLAAFIYLDANEGPKLGRDLNTHIATYREEYIKRLIFPRSVKVGNGKIIHFKKGEEERFFNTLVESKELSFMWRGCVDVVAMCNFTQLNIEIDIYNPTTGKVEERQYYQPDANFPWQEGDANKPNKTFTNQNIKTMRLINYKGVHFNLILDKDHLLLDKIEICELEKHMKKSHKVKRFKCTHCENEYVNKSEIQNHITKYHKDSLVKCTFCVKTFSEICELEKHMEESHKAKQDKCTHCENVFVNKSELQNHIEKYHKDNFVNCTFCDKKFSEIYELEKHMGISHKVKEDKCTHCDNVFVDKDEMKKHSKQCTISKENYSEYLEKKVKSLESRLKKSESMLKESEEGRVRAIELQHEAEYEVRKIKSELERKKIENKCLNNLIEFQKDKVNTHIQPAPSAPISPPEPAPRLSLKQKAPPLPPHGSQDPQQEATSPVSQQQQRASSLVPLQAALAKALQQQVDHQDTQQSLFEPSQQATTEGTKPSLLKHYKSYKEALKQRQDTELPAEETIFKCQECDYPFRSKNKLDSHKKRHNEVLNCPKCNKDFSTKFELKFHKEYETNCERLWTCNECGFQGSSQMLLKTHVIETHNDNKDSVLMCTICKEKFNSSWYLGNHIRDNHQTDEICKHFQMGRCKFSSDECWLNHEVSNLSDNQFACYTCKEMFSTQNLMMLHRKRNHITKQCREFLKGGCKIGDERCWYTHTNQNFPQAGLRINPPNQQQTRQLTQQTNQPTQNQKI